jgi:hypothetical protein
MVSAQCLKPLYQGLNFTVRNRVTQPDCAYSVFVFNSQGVGTSVRASIYSGASVCLLLKQSRGMNQRLDLPGLIRIHCGGIYLEWPT